jgi:hypothetical protein
LAGEGPWNASKSVLEQEMELYMGVDVFKKEEATAKVADGSFTEVAK